MEVTTPGASRVLYRRIYLRPGGRGPRPSPVHSRRYRPTVVTSRAESTVQTHTPSEHPGFSLIIGSARTDP